MKWKKLTMKPKQNVSFGGKSEADENESEGEKTSTNRNNATGGKMHPCRGRRNPDQILHLLSGKFQMENQSKKNSSSQSNGLNKSNPIHKL